MITLEQKSTLLRYSDLKKSIKELEEQAKLLNPEVLEIMEAERVEEIDLGDTVGKLTVGSRRTWIYPENVQDEEKVLKAKKKEAERLGTATYKENRFVIFKGNGESDGE